MQTHPNMVLLAEDVRAKRWSLHDIVREISDVVQARSDMGKEFGAVLVRVCEGALRVRETGNGELGIRFVACYGTVVT